MNLATAKTCRFCGGAMPREPNRFKCPHCRLANFPEHLGADKKPDLIRLGDSKAPKVPRYDVGICNDLFGEGGMARTSVNLIAGEPGAGKTTLLLMLCDWILELMPGRDALYVANEQSSDELEETARRLKLPHFRRIVVWDTMGGLVRPFDSVLSEVNPCFGVLDSLTRLIGEQLDQGPQIVEALKYLAVRTLAPWMVIAQVNKGGDFAGLNKTLHAGDGLYYMEKDDLTGERLARSSKNRNGPAPVAVPLIMMPEGSERPGYLVLDESRTGDEGEDED